MRSGTGLCCFFWIVVWGLMGHQGFTQTFHTRQYTDEDGLPQNSIKAISRDGEGFIWLATESGMVRFDGQEFYTPPRTHLTLNSQRFKAIYPDLSARQEVLFAKNDWDQFVRIEDGKIFPTGPYYAQELMGITALSQLSVSMGLPDHYNLLNDSHAFLIPRFRVDGTFFLCTHQSISYYRQWKKTSEHPHTIRDFNQLFRIGSTLYQRKSDGSWLNVTNRRITSVSITGEILAHPAYKPHSSSLKLFWNNTSDQVFLYLDHSLYLVTARNQTLHTQLILSDFDFVTKNVACVFYDPRIKRVFVGSLSKGLFVCTTNDFAVISQPQEGSDNVFYAQAAYSDTSVITPKGLIISKSRTGEVSTRPVIAQTQSQHMTILKSRDGCLWTKNLNKLFKFDATGQRLLKQWEFKGIVTTTFEDTQGRIWVSVSGEGLFHMNDTGPQLYLPHSTLKVSYLIQETGDRFWIGTDRGLYQLNASSRTLTPIRQTSHMLIRSLHLSRPGEIWFTTAEDGFFLVSEGKVISFPLDASRYLLQAHCIIEDQKGFMWITTNKGLFQVLKQDLLDYARHIGNREIFYHHYTKEHGFLINEFNGGCQPCGLRINEQYVSLPSLNGLVWFKPEQIIPELPNKRAFIDRIEVNGSTQFIEGDSLHLSDTHEPFNIYVTTPYFGSENNLQIAYTFASENEAPKAWYPLNRENKIIQVNQLNPGTYSLAVKVINGFGKNNFSISYLTIVVKHPWYQTTAFLITAFLVGGLLLYFLIEYRASYLKTKNRKLEEAITKRTQELKHTLVVLENSRQELLWQRFIQGHIIAAISHDVKAPLKYVVDLNKLVTEHFEKTSPKSTLSDMSRGIYDSTVRIQTLINNLLDYVKPKMKQASDLDTVSLHAIVSDKAQLFRKNADLNNTTLDIRIPEDLTVKSTHDLLAIIIHNLMDNAIRVTKNGSVRIQAKRLDTNVQFSVEDTGPGMHSTLLNWFNTPLVNSVEIARTDMTVPTQLGLGLIIIKDLSHVLNIELKARSADAHGCSIFLTFNQF